MGFRLRFKTTLCYYNCTTGARFGKEAVGCKLWVVRTLVVNKKTKFIRLGLYSEYRSDAYIVECVWELELTTYGDKYFPLSTNPNVGNLF
jgi:hypothetical protein